VCGFGQVPTFARTCASSSIVLTVVAPLSAITAESGLPTIHTHTHTHTHTRTHTHTCLSVVRTGGRSIGVAVATS
jgi:hypothetical protein